MLEGEILNFLLVVCVAVDGLMLVSMPKHSAGKTKKRGIEVGGGHKGVGGVGVLGWECWGSRCAVGVLGWGVGESVGGGSVGMGWWGGGVGSGSVGGEGIGWLRWECWGGVGRVLG